MKTNLLKELLSLTTAALAAGSALAATYTFTGGHTVLDEANKDPFFPSISTNLAATAGQERDIAVDAIRGIIYIARGNITSQDGRWTDYGAKGVAAIDIANTLPGSTYIDTGLIVQDAYADPPEPAVDFHQSLAYDAVSDQLFVLGGGAVSTPIVFTAPGGSKGGAPTGGTPTALNPILRKAFQATSIPDWDGSPTNRLGSPRGFAVRTVDGITTAYLAMGHHVQAWRRDQTNQGSGVVEWRRIWATLRAPINTNVNNRATDSRVNGIDVDDEGNCFFNVQFSSPARVWMVPAGIETNLNVAPLYLDFADRAVGGTNTTTNAVVLPLIAPPAGGVDYRSPQGVTFCRQDGRKVLFVSCVPAVDVRGVARLTVNTTVAYTNGFPCIAGKLIDSFGSGQPSAGQDAVLRGMRTKQNTAGATQPYGTPSNSLYHDASTRTNPAYIYFNAFVVDASKGQTIPTATIGRVAMPPLPVEPTLPIITLHPQSQTWLEGGSLTFTVAAQGAPELKYQWQLDSNDIAGATAAALPLNNVQLTNAGSYRCVVTNDLGQATSSNATLTVLPLVKSDAMTNLWRLAPGNRPYLTTDDRQRGLAYNAASNTILIATRSPAAAVYVLDGDTGADLHTLSVSGVSNGTYVLNLVGVAEDGAVYAANLTLNGSTDPFKIYRWSTDRAGTAPTVAYSGNPGGAERWGDTLDVRGSGPNTQIIAATRTGATAAIFTTTDGIGFTATLLNTDVAAGDMGLGVGFGEGNVFWTKAASRPLREIGFDLASSSGVTLASYASALFPNEVYAIAINPSRNLLAGVAIENPDNLRLYSIADRAVAPVLVDQELFPADNANANGTGAADFGGNRLYALDSNNGLLAMRLASSPGSRIEINYGGDGVVLTWTGAYILQAATNVLGAYYDVPGAASGFTTNTTSQTQTFFRLRQ